MWVVDGGGVWTNDVVQVRDVYGKGLQTRKQLSLAKYAIIKCYVTCVIINGNVEINI